VLVGAGLLAACGQERPSLGREPTGGTPAASPQTSTLQAGPERPVADVRNPFEGNVHALAEGERLYGWMNCGGCHGPLGGGGIGPPFADGDWIYGGEPANVFQSIVQGRPNGMPAYGGRLPSREIWKIVAYVRSLPARGDEAPARTAGVAGARAGEDDGPGDDGGRDGGDGTDGPGASR
jgi:cytochrome c oxidase cbb3-type subunit III